MLRQATLGFVLLVNCLIAGSTCAQVDRDGASNQAFIAPNLPGGIDPPPLGGPAGDLWVNGVYNWGPGYIATSLTFLLEVTGDEKWAAKIVDWGEQALGQRDAVSPADRRPYAWIDHSSNVHSPYVWIAFTAHNFAPLLQFAVYVLRHHELAAKSHTGRTYRDFALAYLNEFKRVLDIDKAELVQDKQHAYFRFVRHVPVLGKTDIREQLAKLSRGHDLAKAFNYVLKRAGRASLSSSRTAAPVSRTMPPSED